MSLNLPQVLPQVDKLGEAAAERAKDAKARIPKMLQAFEEAGRESLPELTNKISRAGDRWPGAIPTEEPLGAVYPAPAHPPQLNIIGADGSQIHPDRHGAALYYLINIGSILIAHGSGQAPVTASNPRLMFEESDLYGDNEGLIPPALIDGQRDLAEMAELARLAETVAGRPTLALLDNGLLLWLALQEAGPNRREVEHLLSEYLQQLGRLRQTGAAVAGFVDRPRTANVIALLHLAGLPEERINEETLRANPFRGLADRTLFAERLGPGDRSARFTNASPVNQRFRDSGHGIQFFYLRCGQIGQIARIEIPEWVGDSPALLDLVHAGILEQCRTPEGFPYPLVRAHELAVVTQIDRQALDQMLAGVLLRHGLAPSLSQKSLTKQWTSGRRRHRL
jgi:hypothetical protein